MYEAITREEQLPTEGQPVPEHLRFDMKTEPGLPPSPTDEQLGELAKDVAAFANTNGGVILVGAKEVDRVLVEYKRLNRQTAEQYAEHYQRALNLCSPVPVIDTRLVPRASDFVVAINVDAYSAPPIGVRLKMGTKTFWRFPVRRADDAYDLRPEELATIMDPTFRRKVLLLRKITAAQGNQYPNPFFHFTQGGQLQFDLLEIDPDGAMIKLKQHHTLGELVLPIDAVQSVWKDPDSYWHVGVGGLLDQTTQNRYRYLPR